MDLDHSASRRQRRRRLWGAVGAVLVLATSTVILADGGPAAAADDGDVLLETYDPLPTTVEYGQDLVFEGAATDISGSCLVVPFACDEARGHVYIRPAEDEQRRLATAVLQPFLQGNRDLSFWGPMVLDGRKLGPGTHRLFLGIESNFRPVEYPFTLVVTKIACSIDLRQSTPSSNPNEPVSFTATINGNGDHSGQMAFRDQDGGLLANPTITNGLANFTIGALPQGTTTVTASWAGNDVIYDRCSDTVTHTVANDPNPIAVDDTYQVSAGQTIVALPLENDFDLGPGPLRVEYLDSPELGEASAFADGTQLQYTAPEDLVGEDQLHYVVYDGSGQPSNEATITFFIGCEPQAVDDQYPVAFGTPLTVADPGVYDNDERCDLPTTLLSPPTHGTVSYDGQGGGFTYTPDAGFAGRDSFTYRYGQAGDDPTDATVRLRVAPPATTTTTTSTTTPTTPTSTPTSTTAPSSTTTSVPVTSTTTTSQPTTTTTSEPTSTTTSSVPGSTTTSTTTTTPATTSTVPPTTGGPTITGIDPGSGRAGDTITVTGSNFVVGDTTVTVGGVAASAEVEPTRVIGSRLRFVVPSAAAVGEGPIAVTTPFGTTSSATPFTVLRAPTATTSPPVAPSTTGPSRPVGGSGAVRPGGTVSDGTLPRTGQSLDLTPLGIALLAGGVALLALRRRSMRHL